MKSERLFLTLASAVILGSILLSFSVLPAAAEVYPDTENIIVRGSSTAYGFQNDDVPPMKAYVEGDEPPIVAGDRIGSGAAVAAAMIPTCRDGEWNNPDNPSPNLDIFLDKVFQWMNPGAVKVLWYEGHNVYNNISICGDLASALGDLDYAMVPKTTEPITESFLEEYDIVVLPQLQEGDAGTGGDPSAIDNSEVNALKSYVEGGGGLLILDGSDFLGYNFFKVQNKILDGINFSPGGNSLRFQSDSIYDDSSNYGDPYRAVVNVNTEHPIGSNYQSSTGKDTLGTYSISSLATPGISINVIPSYEVAEPGGELVYPVEVSNSYTEDLTIELSSEDNAGWNMSFDDTSLSIPVGESKFTDLRVTVPDSAEMGDKDEITVTATSSEHADVTDSASVTGGVAIRIEASQSVYVDNESPDQNFDGGPLRVGRYGTNKQQSYIMFDNLGNIPSGANITDVKLHLFCFSAYGSAQEMEAVSVPGDVWLEDLMTWNTKPEAGSVLDTQTIGAGSETNPIPYSWNVTSFIEQERSGDGTASLLVRPVETCPPSTNREFEQDNWYDWQLRPFLEVKTGEDNDVEDNDVENIDVSIEVSDDEKEGSPGDQIEFTFNVTNAGDSSDTFSLSASPENGSWTSSVSPDSLTLDADGSDSVTLSVEIPSTAGDGASSSVTVTATSQADSSVSDSAACTAVAKADDDDGGIPLVYAGIIIVVVVVVAAAVFVTRGE